MDVTNPKTASGSGRLQGPTRTSLKFFGRPFCFYNRNSTAVKAHKAVPVPEARPQSCPICYNGREEVRKGTPSGGRQAALFDTYTPYNTDVVVFARPRKNGQQHGLNHVATGQHDQPEELLHVCLQPVMPIKEEASSSYSDTDNGADQRIPQTG